MRRLNCGIWRAEGVSKSCSGRGEFRFVNREGSARRWRADFSSSLSEFADPREPQHGAVARAEPQVRPNVEGADAVLTTRLPAAFAGAHVAEARRALRAAPATHER